MTDASGKRIILENIPTISEEMIDVSEESWDLDRLWFLIHERQQTDRTPHSVVLPIVVLRWYRKEFLIDGRSRINFWKRDGNQGPHSVLAVYKAPNGDI